jgi:hypothetical protein
MAAMRWQTKWIKPPLRGKHHNRRPHCKLLSYKFALIFMTLLWLVAWSQWNLTLLTNKSDGNSSHVPLHTAAPSMAKLPHTTNVQNELIHRAFFGLGHRLHRSAAAWHLAKTLQNVTHFRFHWESCQSSVTGDSYQTDNANSSKNGVDYNVFRYLFGDDLWVVPSFQGEPPSSHQRKTIRKMIVIRNDVYGYIKGQLYKDLQLPVPRMNQSPGTAHNVQQHSRIQHPFIDKLQSDVEFYQLLEQRYRFRHQVEDFMAQYQFSERLVVGLHLRTGNGEGMHFEETGRGVQNETEFVENLVQVMGEMIQHEQQGQSRQHNKIPPLIFLATDTAYLIPVVQKAFQQFVGMSSDDVVVLPQFRLETNQGVTFDALGGTGQKCLDGWQAMVSDMMLLAYSNVLVAAKHSTFTQSLPLTVVFEQQQTFCEVSGRGTVMTCLNGSIQTWLFRDNPSQSHTFVVDSQNSVQASSAVTHPITVLLPDVTKPAEFLQAQSFLSHPWRKQNQEAIFRYGKTKIYKKYRSQKQFPGSKWHFVVE